MGERLESMAELSTVLASYTALVSRHTRHYPMPLDSV